MASSDKAQSFRTPARRIVVLEDQSSVQEIMTRDVYCASPDTTADELTRVFLDRCITGAPVVDQDRRPIGMVSKSDLLRETWQSAANSDRAGDKFHGEKCLSARELMTPIVFCLPHTASVSQAAALMAFEEVHQIPIIDDDGRIVGVISTLDIMRWMARREGYLIP